MELTNRVVRLQYVEGAGLLVSDVVGRLHLLDDDLRLVRSSPVIRNAGPAYGVAVAGDWVVTKDPFGNLTKWSLETLDVVDYVATYSIRDAETLLEGEEPSAAIHRGIGIWRNRVYTNNGYMQFMVLDLETFAVERIVPSVTGSYVPLEWICTEHPDVHVLSDKTGLLYLGSLDRLEFPTVVRLDVDANLHRVRYDHKWDRFWVTQDSGDEDNYNIANGVATVTTDGTVERVLRFARDDVEFLAFSHDYERVYTGGFDGELHIVDNSAREPRIAKTVAGFSHQLIDLAIAPDGALFVLSQDGELVKLTADGEFVDKAPFRRGCVWDIQPARRDPATFYCATDDGVAVVRAEGLGGPHTAHLRLLDHHTPGFGFVRRVAPVDDGWLGITRDARVFRARDDGEIAWSVTLESRAHTIAIDGGERNVLLATNAGGIELDAETGMELGRLDAEGLPVWCCTYLPDGAPLLGTRNGKLYAFDTDREVVRWVADTGNYLKRVWVDGEHVYATGGGGLKQLPLDGSSIVRKWHELLNNTCENGAIVDGAVYIVTYGSQLAWFDYDSCSLLGIVEHIYDFPKGLAPVAADNGNRYLLVGGRGGFVSIYHLDKGGVPVKVRDRFLPRPGYRVEGERVPSPAPTPEL